MTLRRRTQKALLVGINKYRESPLMGCVNDVRDMAHFLVDNCGFAAGDVDLIVDRRATTQAILKRLEWLVRDAQPGDRLFFHYSGHGVQMATRDAAHEVDGLDECVCPCNFDWSDEHVIRDKDFARIFAIAPAGVDLVWISDSCHSGDILREITPTRRLPRTLPPPVDLSWRLRIAHERQIARPGFVKVATEARAVLISGCASSETSADATFENRSNGALTYYLLQELRRDRMRPLVDIVASVRRSLHENGFAQHPQLEGNPDLIARGFLIGGL